jgi:hypothetical protein
MILSQKDINRFWSKVSRGGADDCWPWLAAKSKLGYGVFSVKHKWIGAHRVSFFIHKGYLPDIKQRKLVMHDCENPSCQNPKHLLKGTIKENANYPGCIKKLKEKIPNMLGVKGKDHPRWGLKHSLEAKIKISEKAILRGGWHNGLKRSNATKKRIAAATQGEANGGAILTDTIVRIIRTSEKRNIDLAREYCVDPSLISSIRRRTRWKHIK